MKSVISYLTFNGNCREAMEFYASCIRGELVFQTVGASPLSEQMPADMKECILHCTLTNGSVQIMATDITPKEGRTKGNNVSLMLDCSSEEEIDTCYKKLLVGGNSDHPLENTPWNAIFGDLTDKYGNHWLLNYTKEVN